MAKKISTTSLVFDTPILLVGGGEVDIARLDQWQQRYPVVAVDGGADTALAAGIEPVAIIGDMDSISSVSAFPHSRILPTPDQSRTDFDKALGLLEAPLVLCLGFLGRRFDHALAAVNTLARARQDRVVLIGSHDAVVFRRGDMVLELAAGTRVSLWPVAEQAFLGSDGLEWPLDGLVMNPGGTIGTSNRVADGAGEVRIRARPDGGGYLLMVPADNTASLVAAIAPEMKDI